MRNRRFCSKVACLALMLGAISFSNGFSQSKLITRMGALNTRSFDDGWLFARYGLQPDGTRKEEPSAMEAESFNDAT